MEERMERGRVDRKDAKYGEGGRAKERLGCMREVDISRCSDGEVGRKERKEKREKEMKYERRK